jgi:hypothetical protein
VDDRARLRVAKGPHQSVRVADVDLGRDGPLAEQLEQMAADEAAGTGDQDRTADRLSIVLVPPWRAANRQSQSSSSI